LYHSTLGLRVITKKKENLGLIARAARYASSASSCSPLPEEREFFIDNLLVRIHFFIEMIWWTGLAPSEFDFTFSR